VVTDLAPPIDLEHRADLIRDARFNLTDLRGRLAPTWKPEVHLIGGWTDESSTYEVNQSLEEGWIRWYSVLTTRDNGNQWSTKFMFTQDDYGVLVWWGRRVQYIGYLSDTAWLLLWTPHWDMEPLQAWELCKGQRVGSHEHGFIWTRPL